MRKAGATIESCRAQWRVRAAGVQGKQHRPRHALVGTMRGADEGEGPSANRAPHLGQDLAAAVGAQDYGGRGDKMGNRRQAKQGGGWRGSSLHSSGLLGGLFRGALGLLQAFLSKQGFAEASCRDRGGDAGR